MKKPYPLMKGGLVIPFLTRDKKIYGFQGRSLKKDSEVKYITIILDDEYPKLFGLDSVDVDRPHYLFEGPIDAMFLPNACAVCGGELLQVVNHLNIEKVIMVFDNEPRSYQTCKKILKAINLGLKVCIWPQNVIEKDVNEMILKGVPAEYIKKIIDDNTFNGLHANLAFENWKKINVHTHYM